MALVAGAVTSLVQLLAHYTVFVHQYTLEAVITALFLLAATRLVREGTEVDARRFRRVALAGGIATFFSVPAVFVTFPVVNLGALYAARAWMGDAPAGRRPASSGARRPTTRWLPPRGGCCATARTRAFGAEFADGFLPVDSAGRGLGAS